MGKHAQLVIGPAGSGKSTFCTTIQEYCQLSHRTVHVVNLDPAAETFKYEPTLDIRDLVSLDDVMEELDLGPNGGLVYCMEYLASEPSICFGHQRSVAEAARGTKRGTAFLTQYSL